MFLTYQSRLYGFPQFSYLKFCSISVHSLTNWISTYISSLTTYFSVSFFIYLRLRLWIKWIIWNTTNINFVYYAFSWLLPFSKENSNFMFAWIGADVWVWPGTKFEEIILYWHKYEATGRRASPQAETVMICELCRGVPKLS